MSRELETGPGRPLVQLLAACSLLFVAISVPLALDKVEPNSWYGVRTPASLESEAAWYEINRTGGRIGIVVWLIYGLCLIRYLRRPPDSVLGQLALTGSLAAVALFWALLVPLIVGP